MDHSLGRNGVSRTNTSNFLNGSRANGNGYYDYESTSVYAEESQDSQDESYNGDNNMTHSDSIFKTSTFSPMPNNSMLLTPRSRMVSTPKRSNGWVNKVFEYISPQKISRIASSPKPSIGQYQNRHDFQEQHFLIAYCPSVSTILLLLFISFFGLLAMSYVSISEVATDLKTMAKSSFVVDDNMPNFHVCDRHSTSTNCLNEAEAELALSVIRHGRYLVLMAQQKESEYQCGGNERYLGLLEMSNWLQKKEDIGAEKAHTAISAFAKLADLNIDIGVISVRNAAGDILGITGREKQIHLMCLIMVGTRVVLYGLVLVAVGCGVFYLVLQLVRKYQQNKYRKEQQLYKLVDQVVSAVHSSSTHVGVDHIRDSIFPINQRLKVTGLWDEVMNFIDKHESRITKEVRLVSGVDTEVWRWLGEKKDEESSKLGNEEIDRKNPSCDSPVTKQTASLYPSLNNVFSEDEDSAMG